MIESLKSRPPLRLLLGLLVFLPFAVRAGTAHLEVLHFDSQTLANNPLHDPTVRDVAIFIPAQIANNTPAPIVYYLPGYGGSSESFIAHSNSWLKLTQKIADQIIPMILVVVDAHTRWGGSQYLNSPAQGNYEDYVCDEIRTRVETRHPAATQGIRRIVAGHSSGGFGALRLGMARQDLFDAVIALSPDSDFPTSHLPLVRIASVTNEPLPEIERIVHGKLPPPKDGDLIYALGLSAAYAPAGISHPGEIDWLYDANGHFRPEIWQRWLDNDPLTLVKKDPLAFSPGQSVYLEGAAQDEYSANIGARKIFEVLQTEPIRCTFYEPPGHHGDHVPERLQRGLAWVFGRPLPDIK